VDFAMAPVLKRQEAVILVPHLAGERRGRESNPRIEVLQTPTLPLGYPAVRSRHRNA
jgi:hypothetical protein